METATANGKQRRGRPFEKGDPRIQPGPGRPPAPPPEVRAVQRRVIKDLAHELKLAADLAVDRLVTIVQNPKSRDSDAVSAAAQILDRSFGKPLQAIDARVAFEGQHKLITPEDIKRAALMVAAQHAEDA